MPRTGRLHIPGGCYHLIGRGLERRDIFEHPVDKQDILTRFGLHLARTNSQCLAWALMSNHYHFLVRLGSCPLAKLMAPVLTGFAVSYNRRYQRSGYVFQNRFTSILCDEGSHLLQLVRYIHLNPVRAGMMNTLAELGHYPWTGHAAMLGRHRQDWHFIDGILAHFDTNRSRAVDRYLAFMSAAIETGGKVELPGAGLVRSYAGWESTLRLRKEHQVRIGDERILGDSNFVEKALREDEISIESRSRLIRQGWSLERLVNKVCAQLGVNKADLKKRTRNDHTSRAKEMICYCGTEKLGLTAQDIAHRLDISQPAVSRWVMKGRQRADEGQQITAFDE